MVKVAPSSLRSLKRIMDKMEALESYLAEPYTARDIRRARAVVSQMKRLAMRTLNSEHKTPSASGKTAKSKRSGAL